MMRNGVQERSVRLKKWDDRDQSYEGEFLGDSLHGQGTYRWNKTDVYEGGFFSNQKEGYAVLSFSNNSSFEGLFIKNRPFGPGILTHSNGRQDAGFWIGQKLVRLSRPVDFIVPRLAPTSAAKIKLLQFRRLITLNEKNNDSASYILKKYGCSPDQQCLLYSNLIYDPRSIFFNYYSFEKTFFIKARNLFENLFESRYLNKSEDFLGSNILEYVNKENSESGPNANCLCPGTFVMEYRDKEDSFDICTESYASMNNQLGFLAYYSKYGTFEDGESRGKEEIGEEEEEDEEAFSPTQIVSWNRSELCTEMLKQIFRHRTFEEKLNFKIAKLMLGVRTEFRRTGEKEKECLQFLKMCSLGPVHVVKDLMCHYELSEELMDSRGNTSLMFAAAADQHEIIDLLLDYGVDVNTFNDEGLTPLNLCLLRRLAQSNKICSWETAFLPTEIQKVTENNFNSEVWEDEESIESLDRIFGDGMSADSRTGISQILEPEGDTNETEEERDTSTSIGGHQTIMMKAEFVPKSIRRDEFEQSVKCSAQDRYLFDLSSERQTVEVDKKKDASKSKNTKMPKEVDNIEEEEEEGEYDRKEVDLALVEKLREIDKTIEKLLSRGADPNISEVPKPSIHLGVFTKDINMVNTLLHFGADPNCQTYPNEGLLTPLHVIALLKSAPENVEICRTLLNAGANLEEETSPDFSIYEDEKGFLDNVQGRTPLQVLCMRPDLEYADPKGYVTQIGLMLAKYSDKKHFYKGHSFLTLAMLTGNTQLLTALLESNYYDPNETLGNDLGTALHVLVSTQFQKNTIYENSIKMCDLLLSAKADPLKVYKTPSKLTGTCVDYGYREIDEEKAMRKVSGIDKTKQNKETKGSKQEKDTARDHLKDHIKVVEYLEKKASDLKRASIPTESYLEKNNGKRRRNQTGKQNVKRESETLVLDEDGNPDKSRQQTEHKNFPKIDNAAKSKKENELKDFDQTRKQRDNPHKTALDENGSWGKSKREYDSNNFDQNDKKRRKNEPETFTQNGYQQTPKRKSFDGIRNSEKPRNENVSNKFNSKRDPKNSLRENEIKNYENTGKQGRENEQKSFDETRNAEKSRKETESTHFERKRNRKDSDRENEQKSFNKIGNSEKPRQKTESKNVNSNGNPRNPQKEQEHRSFHQNDSPRTSKIENEPNKFDKKGNISNPKRKNEIKSFNQNENLRNSKRDTKPKNYDQKERSGDPIQGDKSKGFEKSQKEKKRENPNGGRNFDSQLDDAMKKGYLGKNVKRTFDEKMADDKDGRQHSKPRLDKQTNKIHKNSKSDIFRIAKKDSSLEGRKRMLRVFKSFSLSKDSSERFPENLRQSMLQVFGNCVTIDVNQLLLPYVVLRNGDLYYMFEGQRPHKTEQYSLI